jgi:tryptophan synthase alpha chain
MITQAIIKRKKAVLPYVTAGVPSLDITGEIIHALEEAGAAAIEIGLPFSDPMADGPVLQKASYMALQAGFNTDDLLARLKGWSTRLHIPLIVMSYINPLMRKGLQRTLKNLHLSGVKGVIIPDLPRDAQEIYSDCREIGLDLIRLVAPTTSKERHSEVLGQCSGFVYAVSIKGVTGQRDALPSELRSQVSLIRKFTELPVCIGFGVSTASQVDELHSFADGVIVGSFLMDRIMNSQDPVRTAHEALRELLNDIQA